MELPLIIFFPQRGCRQGGPISPYLFLLCAEVLGILIRNYKEIRGIEIDGVEYKLSQYANDTSIIFDGLPQSMDGILRELDCFACISTLKIISPKLKWYGSEVKKFQKKFFATRDGSLTGKIPLLIYSVLNFLLI